MCTRITCGKCGKPTYAGCGAHIEQVLGDVPKGERCQCAKGGQPANRMGSWFQTLVGKK